MSGEVHRDPNINTDAKILQFSHRPNPESMDFSRISADIATELFVTDFTHPSRAREHGEQLASSVAIELGANRANRDPSTLQGRLAELRERADMFADFDARMASDSVFIELIQYLENTKDKRSLTDQRKATRMMAELRASLRSYKTPVDPKWHQIIHRLFT